MNHAHQGQNISFLFFYIQVVWLIDFMSADCEISLYTYDRMQDHFRCSIFSTNLIKSLRRFELFQESNLSTFVEVFHIYLHATFNSRDSGEQH